MEQVSDRTTLVLASVVYKVKYFHSIWASSVIQRLENHLGIHSFNSRIFFVLDLCINCHDTDIVIEVYKM